MLEYWCEGKGEVREQHMRIVYSYVCTLLCVNQPDCVENLKLMDSHVYNRV